MKAIPIIEVRDGQQFIVCDPLTFLRFEQLVMRDFLGGKLAPHGAKAGVRGRGGNGGGSPECEDVCEPHDGVDICGAHVVRCNDGYVAILET